MKTKTPKNSFPLSPQKKDNNEANCTIQSEPTVSCDRYGHIVSTPEEEEKKSAAKAKVEDQKLN